MRSSVKFTLAVTLTAAMFSSAWAQKKYDSGASDTEIKIGQTMPYSGPASAYGTQGKTEIAFWKMINSKGGINGRQINFISLDDGYSPPKTVEQTRRLVEEEGILANIGSLGTPTNSAIQKYLNSKKMPHIFISTGASKWNEPKTFPYTVPLYPPYFQEAKIYGKAIAGSGSPAKIAVLFQNDDFGKDYLKGLKEGLGDKVGQIVKEVSFEVTDPTIDSQMIALQTSGADTFVNITTPKFAAQAIKKAAALGWKPKHYLVSVASSIGGVLEPAGLENSTGLYTALAVKVVGDPNWDNDAEMKDFLKFMKEWYPDGNPLDGSNATGYIMGHLTVALLKKMGDTLTRENMMKQLTSMKNVPVPMLLPGITVSFSPDDYSGYNTFRLARFDGKKWALTEENISTAGK